MSTLGIAIASVFSVLWFAPPDETGPAADEAPVIVVAPAPAPAPTPAPDWGPGSSVIVSRATPPSPAEPPPPVPPAPPQAPSMGIGLYVGGAVAFTLGLAARLARVDTAVTHCSEWNEIGFTSAPQCFNYFDTPGVDGNDMFVGAAYGSSIVLTSLASATLGRYQAWETAFAGERTRSPVSRWTFGAIFTGLGVAGIATHFALVYTAAQNPCTTWECNVERRALWIAASDGGAMMLNVGFGLFSWANHYRRNLEQYRALQWSVLPSGPRGPGLTATVRF
jgi:hypothetical protein